MNFVSARAGFDWLRKGLTLFARQPAALSLLFVVWILIVVPLSLLGPYGLPLALFLMALYPPAMMRAAQLVDQGQRVTPLVFREAVTRRSLLPQLVVTAFLLLAGVLAVALMNQIDGGVTQDIMIGKLDPESDAAHNAPWGQAFAVMMLIIGPAGVFYWFACVVMRWRETGLAKGLFFTVISLVRGVKAFLMLAWGLFALNILCGALSSLIGAVTGWPNLMLMIFGPMLAMVVQCSLYAAYTQLVGTATPDVRIDTTA